MNCLKVFPFTSCVLLAFLTACYGFEDKTIYEYLKNENAYQQFATLVKKANLDTTLDGSGPYTVLVPTDAALAKLDPAITATLNKNSLMLKNLIKYHILNGFSLIPEFRTGRDETALNGQPIVVSNMNNIIILNNASRITTNNDIILRNGVIHPIETVLIPPVFSTYNLAQEIIARDKTFGEFISSLLLTNITEIIESGEYTVFAPIDRAYTETFVKIFYNDMPNVGYYFSEMLRYHIVPGARSTSQLKNGDVLYSLHGYPIHIKIDNTGVYADNAKVIQADIGASNGVIHAIDKLLFPEDLWLEIEQSG